MVSRQAVNAYRTTERQADIHPVKLIHMLYERLLTHLEHAEKAIADQDPRKRGENLGKAIAILTELNASIKQDDDSEAAHFLRGLYSSILVELPRVSVSNDPAVVRQARRYIDQLKTLWEETAMQEHGLAGEMEQRYAAMPKERSETGPAATALAGVSVSI